MGTDPVTAWHGSVRYDLSVRKGDGTWPSLVKALVWGTREPGFKSRRPDSLRVRIRCMPGRDRPQPRDPPGWHDLRAPVVCGSEGGVATGEPRAGSERIDVAGELARWPSHARWWLRRLVIVAVSITLVLLAAAAALMLATPSVSNAASLAREQASDHHETFPGPVVPVRFATALISTEDHRFSSEPGIDPFAIGRVLLAGLTASGDQGGATLYQQLAKLLYTPGRTGFSVETEQVALAIKLKFSYSGPQILRLYAEVAYFGHGFYGLAQASCGYFGRQADRLSWPQAALLAGLVQAPSAYDPLEHPNLARSRQRHVVSRLVATGALTARQATAALAVPLDRLLAGAGTRCSDSGRT
jgi:membrane peptidoglycan carboxypeptidase